VASVAIINYRIQCGHVAKAPATLLSGVLYCGHCNGMYTITDVITHEWKASCNDCRYARWCGVGGKAVGEIFANGHIRRNTGHRVSVAYAENPDAAATKIKFNSWRAGVHA
jgi:hypothetical protein